MRDGRLILEVAARMPRKKQDNPQHVDEMDTTTLTNTAANSTSNDTTAAAGYESNTAVASPGKPFNLYDW